MTDMPMTTPGQWGKNKPRNLQEALAGVRTSLKMIDDAKKPSGAVGAHVATIEDAAVGLLDVINDRSSGQTVRNRVAQFDAGTTAAKNAVNAEIGRGNMSVGPAAALLGSIDNLRELAQNL
jgi:hypothetical protein